MTPLFSLDVYRNRRAALIERLASDLRDGPDDIVILVASAPEQVRSHDVHHPYRASNDLVYLTGFAEPNSLAVLRPGDPDTPFVLFVPPRDPKKEQWEGRRAGVDGAVDVFEADAAFEIGNLPEELPALLSGRRHLFHALRWRQDVDDAVFAAFDQLRGGRKKPDRRPRSIVDFRLPLSNLRRVKDEGELDVMREAARIAAEAHVDAMRALRPGQYEYEIGALLDYAFRRRGATGPGYETIVGGGDNATILHYTTNTDPLHDGDLVLIDAGCEYRHYNADITRTFPVGKRFTPFQRDLYQGLLEVQIEAIDKMRPGYSANEANAWSRRRLTDTMVDLGLLKGDPEQLFEDKAYERFYMHGLGHYLGMDVHDVGTYLRSEDDPQPFEPGVVMTVEPGIYIPADTDDLPAEMRGIGIRIEDDVIITEGDPEVITAGVPKDPDEIEALRG